ncbi:MAG TPA: HEAT repeat domain-containing protein [Pyrinomonadaceae bacterium]
MKRLTPSRPRRAALMLLLLTLTALATPEARAETYFVDGYELEVTLGPTRSSYVFGETVVLNLKFVNRADIDLELFLSGEKLGAGWPDDFEITVTGPDGKVLPRPAPAEREQPHPYTNTFVRAVRPGVGASINMSILLTLEHWAKIERPGVYAVTLRRGLRVGPYGRRYRIFPETTKPAVELRFSTEFKLTEGGAEITGKLIEEQGALLLACNQSTSVGAATRLADLKDERALKYMTEALRTCNNPSIRYTALGAFGRLDTDAAFEGLRAAAADRDEDFRTVAATMIAKSKHREARRLLLSLRKDPYYGVRVVVLSALESWDTAQARRLIQEMTNDEHPQVRDEALRFLQERAGHPPRNK